MEQRTYKYGGQEFQPEEIGFIRHLALGAEIGIPPYGGYDKQVLERLKLQGWAHGYLTGTGKNERATYRASDRLRALRDVADATRLTFDELAQKMGLDISPAAIKGRMRKRRLAPLSCTLYPSIRDLELQRLIEQQGPLYTEAPDVELDHLGREVPLFSSRGLTDWYVGEFCKLNHLRP